MNNDAGYSGGVDLGRATVSKCSPVNGYVLLEEPPDEKAVARQRSQKEVNRQRKQARSKRFVPGF